MSIEMTGVVSAASLLIPELKKILSSDFEELQKRLHKTDAELQAAVAKEQALEQTRAFIAHEVRSAIGPLNAYAQMLYDVLEQPELDKAKLSALAQRIIKQTHAAYQVVDEYVEYSRLLTPNFERIDIIELVDNVLEEYKIECEKHNIEMIGFTIEAKADPKEASNYLFSEQNGVRPKYKNIKAHSSAEKVEAMIDKQMITQVLRNLIKNAIEAMDRGGQLTTIIIADELIEWVSIQIIDTGGGFIETALPRAFELGFTTKMGKRGAGVGLALSQRLIEQAHKGIIRALNKENGALVAILLPLSQGSIVDAK